MRRAITSVLLTILLIIGVVATAQTAELSKAEIEKRVEAILGKMTLEEKIDYIGGHNSFYIRAIPRLGVPELKMADGPMGVRNYGPATAFPAGIAMAASWDTELVHRIGVQLGRDSRARGVHFLLGPGMNIYRAPMNGRNFEYFGEDPFLASRLAVASIKGIQSQGVIATAKHYAANNQEWDRHRISSDVDERTLREIYLPAFEASVKEARVGSIMDSYNLINGVHATQNAHLNIEIARKEWGFTGIMMSDWDATYDGVGAANGGLDLEMPFGKFMNRQALLPAVRDGRVSEAVIDEKVRRIVRTAIEFGFFDRNQEDSSISLLNQQGRQVALEAARGSMVLLKNTGVLPFDKSKVKTVAVIGPTAHPAVTGGGGSSKVNPLLSTSFLEGISNYAGAETNVVYSAGIPKLSDIYDETQFTVGAEGGLRGMTAEYFNNTELSGTPALTRRDRHVNFRWGQASYVAGGPVNDFSVRWTGYFTPDASAEYKFYVSGDDGYRVFVDDKPLIERWQTQGDTLTVKTLNLEQGKTYKVRLEYFEAEGDSVIGFGIGRATDRALLQAKEAAAKADAVVLCIGFDAQTEGEGFDRTFALPGAQEELIRHVLGANKNVAVVLVAGGNVDMNGWSEQTPALLHAWYPGQEGGRALAEILFGAVNPSGKLPVSFERRWEDNPTHNSYYDPNLPAGQGGDGPRDTGEARGHVAYKEGVFLGYRYFDRSETKPMFPFGYGLSYTTFKYSNLKVTPGTTNNGTVTVSFDVTNSGKREGAEVAQVYVNDKHAKIDRPVKELKGFAKVSLKPGETRKVSVTLDRRSFSYYDVTKKDWTADAGEFGVLVGSSSADIRLEGKIRLTD
ncbi:MAG TPA: glycoside hydrolase family 3 C-terminal domain-containing protein [Terriglobales bacterium]|nr:glycoside hydrolase family 3 C-terminal domain-containing protein [Terriglobales bacterium]